MQQLIYMKITDWTSLADEQRHALLLSMHIRNALEDFHIENLSDNQMKELNQITRYAIYDAIVMMEDSKHPLHSQRFERLVAMIPDYWEIPGRDARPKLDRAA